MCTKGEERARACMDNLPPLRIRRLRNYVCRLKGARRSWERGCLAERAWRSIHAASLFMAVHFGTPAMNPHLEQPDEVVGQVLHSTILHYEQVLKDEEKKLRDEARAAIQTVASCEWRSEQEDGPSNQGARQS